MEVGNESTAIYELSMWSSHADPLQPALHSLMLRRNMTMINQGVVFTVPVASTHDAVSAPFDHSHRRYLCLAGSLHIRTASLTIALVSVLAGWGNLLYAMAQFDTPSPPSFDRQLVSNYWLGQAVVLAALVHILSACLILVGLMKGRAELLLLCAMINAIPVAALMAGLVNSAQFPSNPFAPSPQLWACIRAVYAIWCIWISVRCYRYMRDVERFEEFAIYERLPLCRRNAQTGIILERGISNFLRARENEREARFKRY